MGATARKKEWTFKRRQDADYSKGGAYQKYREPSDTLPARPSPLGYHSRHSTSGEAATFNLMFDVPKHGPSTMKRMAPENRAEGVYLGEPRSPFSANQYLAWPVQAFKSRHDSPMLVKSFQM